MGSLFKQIYRYTRPRAYRHNENLWPWVKIRRAESGEICALQYKGESVPLCSLSELKDAFSGPMLLTATGPSINDVDFSINPSSLPVMGVNGAYFLEGKVGFSLYLIVDMEFFDRKPEVIAGIVSNPRILFFTTTHGIAKIIERIGLNNIQCRLALIEDACYKIYQPKIPGNDIATAFSRSPSALLHQHLSHIGFSTDIRKGIFDAGTVAYWALQIIAWLGFNRIIIAGLDMNNFEQPRFYENGDNKLPSYLADKVDGMVFPAFELASRHLQAKGITVINLSLNSAIPEQVFPKMPLSQALYEVA